MAMSLTAYEFCLTEASSPWELDLVSDPQRGHWKCMTLFYE